MRETKPVCPKPCAVPTESTSRISLVERISVVLFQFNSVDWQTRFVAMVRTDSTERETSMKINQSNLHTKFIAKLVYDYAYILHGV